MPRSVPSISGSSGKAFPHATRSHLSRPSVGDKRALESDIPPSSARGSKRADGRVAFDAEALAAPRRCALISGGNGATDVRQSADTDARSADPADPL